MLVIWPEKVLRLASIDCSSPMSAKIDWNTGTRDPSAAGIRRPACAISASSPAVLSATVLPPVFGPVISRTVAGGITLIVTGTGRASSGCRAASSSNAPSVDSAGSIAVDRLGEPGPRLDDVELARRLDRPLHVVAAAAERVGQRQQDAQDLFMLLFFERDDVVVDFDRAERLEKQAGAARRRAVDDAGNGAAMLGLDDEHVAAVPLGDDLVLQILRRVLAAQVRLERAPQPGPLLAEPIADDLQFGARVIDHVARRIDLVPRLRRSRP